MWSGEGCLVGDGDHECQFWPQSGSDLPQMRQIKWSRSYFTTFWLQNVVISCASSWYFFSNRSNKLSSWYFFLIDQINFKSAWLTLIDWYNHTICKRIVRVTILLHVSSIASPACHEFDALGNISLYKRIEDVIVVRNEYWLEWYLTSRIKAPVVCHGPPWTLRHADIRSRDTTYKNSMI